MVHLLRDINHNFYLKKKICSVILFSQMRPKQENNIEWKWSFDLATVVVHTYKYIKNVKETSDITDAGWYRFVSPSTNVS